MNTLDRRRELRRRPPEALGEGLPAPVECDIIISSMRTGRAAMEGLRGRGGRHSFVSDHAALASLGPLNQEVRSLGLMAVFAKAFGLRGALLLLPAFLYWLDEAEGHPEQRVGANPQSEVLARGPDRARPVTRPSLYES